MSASDQPSAFLSYVRSDDRDERLTQFLDRLGGEIEMQLGGAFDIFRDRTHISWGQQWQERIDGSLDAVTFLIPIITPSYFNSAMCRQELEAFRTREQGLDREDLILPVYWITTPQLTSTGDALAELVAARNYADWRDLRHADYSSPEAGRTLARFAEQLVASLQRAPRPRATPKAKPAPDIAAEARSTTPQGATSTPRTLVVDPMSRGTHTVIAEAIADAEPGDRILVRAGVYRENLVIDKPIELLGEGPVDDIVLEDDGLNAIWFSASMGRVSGITVRQREAGDYCALWIEAGRAEITNCVVVGRGNAAVGIEESAHAAVRHLRIAGQLKTAAIWAMDSSMATVEDCDITAAPTGLFAHDMAEIVARRNRITDSGQDGVQLADKATMTLEDNQILSSRRCGLFVEDTPQLTALRNRIAGSKYEAIELRDSPTGRIAENDLRGNGTGPWDRKNYTGDGVVILGNTEE